MEPELEGPFRVRQELHFFRELRFFPFFLPLPSFSLIHLECKSDRSIVMLLGVMACLDVLDSVRYFRNVQHQLLLKRQESLRVSRDGDAGIQESP